MAKKREEKPSDKRLYTLKYKWFLENGYSEVEPLEFYRDIFPENSFEEKGEYSGKPNGILVDIKDGKGRQQIVTDDLSAIQDLQGQPDIIMSPIGYYGRRRTTKNSSLIYALTFDLDGQGMRELKNTLHQMQTLDPLSDPPRYFLPPANYVVLSGHGLHLYYVFDKPIPMRPYIRRELNKLKNGLTWLLWNDYCTTEHENIQYQPITQGFRVVGSASKMGENYPVRAFKLRAEKWAVRDLNNWFPTDIKSFIEYRANIDIVDVTPIDQAKELWPDWYERRIVKGEKKGRWYVKRALYDWWLRQIQSKGKEGHRYFCIMTLAVFAKKCDVPFDELKKDAYALIKQYDDLSSSEDNRFTKKDVNSALKAYKEGSCTYPRDTIGRMAGITMPVNKRNYLTQAEHLEIARGIRDIRMKQKGKKDWREGNGRPPGAKNKACPKGKIIQAWREKNPQGRKIDCHRDTGISRTTIDKYWQ